MTIADLNGHLKTGTTHVCLCWSLARKDGVVFGFTDHDRSLSFDGVEFTPDSGMAAKALTSTTGLSVNNTEALGILSSDAVTDADIEAGRYEGAIVTTWLVQWDDVSARQIKLRGSIGEIVREGGSYRADLRGLTEMLNQPQGRAYLKTCSAVLGDEGCKFKTNAAAYQTEGSVGATNDRQTIDVDFESTFTDRWFEGGLLTVLSGAAVDVQAVIKRDEAIATGRRLTLWQPLPAELVLGDQVRILAGCDKRAETCRVKFDNLINFQGFPDIPGDDWLTSIPRSEDENDGGSLNA